MAFLLLFITSSHGALFAIGSMSTLTITTIASAWPVGRSAAHKALHPEPVNGAR